MFIRKKTHKDPKTGNKYFTYQLIESLRTERGPRQRILLSLGKDLSISDTEFKLLANRIEEIVAGAQNLFEYPKHIEQLASRYARQLIKKGDYTAPQKEPTTDPEYCSVDLNSLEHNDCRTTGIEYIAYETVKKLNLDQTLKNLGFNSRQVKIALALIIGRLAFPASENRTYQWLQNQTALDDLLGADFDHLSLNSLYQVGDKLFKNKRAIEEHLASTEQSIFSLENTVFFYDLTNTYFEGSARDIDLAARGRSKEHRSDCPLVTLGLVVDEKGFPKKSKVLPGNVSEPSTLKKALEEIDTQSSLQPVVVMDAGIATEENLQYLRDQGYAYIVSSRLRSFTVPEDLEMETVKDEPGNLVTAAQTVQSNGEIYLYCKSEGRKQKEEQMRSLLQKRFEADLEKISLSLQKKRVRKSYLKIIERVSRLKEKHKRIAHYYTVDVQADSDKSNAIAITWEVDLKRLESRFEGTYLLRIHGLKWETSRLWKTYTLLTGLEEAFRCLKTDLGLRPIFHKKDHRVEAHLLITVLAYHVMQTILYQLRLSKLHLRWSTVQQILSTQVRVTTTMRLEDGRQVHIRSNTRPEPEQKKIYDALCLKMKANTRKTFI